MLIQVIKDGREETVGEFYTWKFNINKAVEIRKNLRIKFNGS